MLAVLAVVPPVAAATEGDNRMRALAPIIAELQRSKDPEMRDLSFVCARGAALFMALAGTMSGGATTNEERALAAELQKRALPFYQVALVAGLIVKQSAEETEREIKEFTEAYAASMARSRERGESITSPAVRAEMQALLTIVPLVTDLAAGFEKQADDQAAAPKT